MIDHVLVTVSIDVIDAAVVVLGPGERCPSDHFPILADLRFSEDDRRISTSIPNHPR